VLSDRLGGMAELAYLPPSPPGSGLVQSGRAEDASVDACGGFDLAALRSTLYFAAGTSTQMSMRLFRLFDMSKALARWFDEVGIDSE
jgi:hypothetical protein